jgi:anti-sigma B factor antagonist
VNVERHTAEAGTILLALSGEIDLVTADVLGDAIDSAVGESPARIVLDFADVSFIDSSGLAAIAVRALAVETIEIRNAHPIVRRVIELTGLDGVLKLTGTASN